MPSIDQTTEIASYVHTYSELPSYISTLAHACKDPNHLSFQTRDKQSVDWQYLKKLGSKMYSALFDE